MRVDGRAIATAAIGLAVAFAIGLAIYFAYGRGHSLEGKGVTNGR